MTAREVAPPPLPAPPDERLPDGFAVRLDPATRRLDGGASLLGGSPLRLLRLSPAARRLLPGDRLVVDGPVAAALAGRLLDAGVANPDLGADLVNGQPLTVVVPVRDRAAPLDRLLRALRDDPTTAHARVIVVDDGSRDSVAVNGVATAHGAEVLRHEVSRGPAAARNAGLRATATDLVAFVDSDCVPRPGWLAALRPHLADPRLAVVAPRVVALPDAAAGWLGRYETAVSAIDMGPAPAAVRPFSQVSYVPSAALLARRSALGAGFDETMRVAEDVDLVWRLCAAGWRVRYEPAAAVAHDHPTTTLPWLRRRAFYGTGAALLAARHGPAVAPLVISPWSGLAWALALAGLRPGPARWFGPAGAATLLALGSTRLGRRLAGPDGSRPLGLATRLVVGGTAVAGRALARSATRSHWPLTAVAALASRRVRRVLPLLLVAEAVPPWWAQRASVGPLRFLAARRLEDLGYGAGLWWGALRARDARALLPARPPDLSTTAVRPAVPAR